MEDYNELTTITAMQLKHKPLYEENTIIHTNR